MRRIVVRIVGCIFVVFLCLAAFIQIEKQIIQLQKENIKQAVLSAAIQCYVIEGAYPNNLNYLKDQYGLIVDSSKYIIDYQCFGSNQMPIVKILYIQD